MGKGREGTARNQLACKHCPHFTGPAPRAVSAAGPLQLPRALANSLGVASSGLQGSEGRPVSDGLGQRGILGLLTCYCSKSHLSRPAAAMMVRCNLSRNHGSSMLACTPLPSPRSTPLPPRPSCCSLSHSPCPEMPAGSAHSAPLAGSRHSGHGSCRTSGRQQSWEGSVISVEGRGCRHNNSTSCCIPRAGGGHMVSAAAQPSIAGSASGSCLAGAKRHGHAVSTAIANILAANV